MGWAVAELHPWAGSAVIQRPAFTVPAAVERQTLIAEKSQLWPLGRIGCIVWESPLSGRGPCGRGAWITAGFFGLHQQQGKSQSGGSVTSLVMTRDSYRLPRRGLAPWTLQREAAQPCKHASPCLCLVWFQTERRDQALRYPGGGSGHQAPGPPPRLQPHPHSLQRFLLRPGLPLGLDAQILPRVCWLPETQTPRTLF